MANFTGPKAQKQIVLDGPVSSGKSIALAMLVHWARDEGWLVFYVPKGRDWTHGGFFYKNPQTGFFDTPAQAANILQARITSSWLNVMNDFDRMDQLAFFLVSWALLISVSFFFFKLK